MILFKPEHILLIQLGIKTETRRVWKTRRAKKDSIHKAKTQMLSKDFFAKLLIKEVKYERLLDISEESAQNEGGYTKEQYLRLWDQINRKSPAVVNPWIWVVKFQAKIDNFLHNMLKDYISQREFHHRFMLPNFPERFLNAYRILKQKYIISYVPFPEMRKLLLPYLAVKDPFTVDDLFLTLYKKYYYCFDFAAGDERKIERLQIGFIYHREGRRKAIFIRIKEDLFSEKFLNEKGGD